MAESTELTVIERAVKALSGVANEKVLQDLVAQSATILAIKNADGRTQCHSAYMALKNRRTAITAVGKESREDATKFSKAVIAEENRLVGLIVDEEERLKTLRDAWDAAREAERVAILNAEAERVAAINHKINQLRSLPVDFHNRSADEIKIALDDLDAFEATEAEFAELVNEAHSVKIDTIAALKTLHANAVQRAEEAQKLADERAELARLQAEHAEQARIAAAERAEQDRIASEARAAQEAAQRAELARLREEAAERERVAAAERAEQAAKDRAAREAQEAADRETKRKADEAMAAERDAHERRMADDREALRIAQDALNADRQRIADEAAERQRSIDAEFAAEQARILAAKQAEAAEQARRERQDFVNNGPDASDIITIIANAYVVDQVTALNWLNMHAWDQVEVAA
jgi:hypothetical protein